MVYSDISSDSESDIYGWYESDKGRITIFAKQGNDFFENEDTYFHENLHAFIDKEYNGAKEEISEFYEDARINHPRGFDRCVPALRDLGYAEETLPEELFVYTASKRLVNGTLASDMHFFTLGVRNIIEEYTNRIGYDINEEERLRSDVSGFSDGLHMRDSVREETPERRGGEESEGGSRSDAGGARGYTGDGVDWHSSILYQREVLRETARVIGVPMELVQGTYEYPGANIEIILRDVSVVFRCGLYLVLAERSDKCRHLTLVLGSITGENCSRVLVAKEILFLPSCSTGMWRLDAIKHTEVLRTARAVINHQRLTGLVNDL